MAKMKFFSRPGDGTPAEESATRNEVEKEVVSSELENQGPEANARSTQEIDPALEKRVRRKLDWHIVPLVSALYLLAFLDRSNIGYDDSTRPIFTLADLG